MEIVCLMFDGFTPLDVVGPYEVLARMPGAKWRMVAPQAGLVRSEDRAFIWNVESDLEHVSRADLLLVPGGFGTRSLLRDERVLAWLRAVDATTQITASVCTGALLLAAAGLLQGRRANTHWAVRERLADFGAVPAADRYVRDGKYASAAGVSAGIDLALALAIELSGLEVAERIQLAIEYDPAPPISAGNAERAPVALCEAYREKLREREAQVGYSRFTLGRSGA